MGLSEFRVKAKKESTNKDNCVSNAESSSHMLHSKRHRLSILKFVNIYVLVGNVSFLLSVFIFYVSLWPY